MPQSAETELSTQKTLQGKIASNTIHSFQTFSVHSLRGRHKKGRGRGEGEKREREKRKGAPSHPFLPNPPPFSLPHYPFDACYTQATTYTVRLQGLQNSKSNHFYTPRAVPYLDDTAF